MKTTRRNRPPNDLNDLIMTSCDAEKALRRDAANVLKRVKSGKPITSAERKLLQSLAAGGTALDPRFVRTQVELAAALEVDRRTIARWLRADRNPGRKTDGRYDLNEWREWKASCKAGARDGEIDPKDEKARQLVLQNKKLEFQISVMKREYVPSEDVEAWVGQMVAQAKRVLLGSRRHWRPRWSVSRSQRRNRSSGKPRTRRCSSCTLTLWETPLRDRVLKEKEATAPKGI